MQPAFEIFYSTRAQYFKLTLRSSKKNLKKIQSKQYIALHKISVTFKPNQKQCFHKKNV